MQEINLDVTKMRASEGTTVLVEIVRPITAEQRVGSIIAPSRVDNPCYMGRVLDGEAIAKYGPWSDEKKTNYPNEIFEYVFFSMWRNTPVLDVVFVKQEEILGGIVKEEKAAQ